MSLPSPLANANIAALEQAIDLLGRINDAVYTHQDPRGTGSSIGRHLRHAIDHYERFFAGLDAGRINYESRNRDPQVEEVSGVACASLNGIRASLAALREADEQRHLEVVVEAGNEPTRPIAASTVRRELDFLLGHTVHHFALMAVTLRLQGVDPGREFGVAPSTLRYEQANPALTE